MTAYALFNDYGDCTAVMGVKALREDAVPVADGVTPDQLWRSPAGEIAIRESYDGLPEAVPAGFVWEALGVADSRAFVDGEPVHFPLTFTRRGQHLVEVKGRYRMLRFVQVTTYVDDRARAYPPIEDQLDQIFHEGVDAWRATIAAVKDQFPKISPAGE